MHRRAGVPQAFVFLSILALGAPAGAGSTHDPNDTVTIYVRGLKSSPEELHGILARTYAGEPFVHVLPFGAVPQTRHVRGSNMTFIGVAKDRVPGRGERTVHDEPGVRAVAVPETNFRLEAAPRLVHDAARKLELLDRMCRGVFREGNGFVVVHQVAQ